MRSNANAEGGKGVYEAIDKSTGLLGVYKEDGTLLYTVDKSDTLHNASIRRVVRNIRRRFTIAEINAGATLLSAIAGVKYRMVAARAIAIGGAVGALTTVDILGTQSTSQKLVAFAQAGLTRSAVLKDGDASSAVLADGASYAACDANTAITVGKTGSTGTTATHVDISFDYVLEV